VSLTGNSSEPLRVLVAGGGVAALEATLALRELAGDRIDLTMVAPNQDLVYRPMTVGEPFAYPTAARYPIERIANDVGVDLVKDSFAWVVPSERVVHLESGAKHRYDALVLGLGARVHVRYEHAITIDDRRLDEQLHGLIQDVEGGYVKRLAFVIPPRMAWLLPVYELAMMTAGRAYDMGVELAVTILTPEERPLAIFGDGAASAVSKLLAEKGIEVITSAYCEIPKSGQVVITPGDRPLEVDRIVALPELHGPAVRGLPGGSHAFIPIDEHCRVRGVERVYAAGDATEFAVKHGGIAAQQADTAAESIAALAGAPVEPKAFRPSIHGIVLTGGQPLYLSAYVTGGHGFQSQITDKPTWSPPTKIAARYLAPYLDERDRATAESVR
jgi:sulfide:quinone oxidoreductase